jgi:hypothetical protein
MRHTKHGEGIGSIGNISSFTKINKNNIYKDKLVIFAILVIFYHNIIHLEGIGNISSIT